MFNPWKYHYGNRDESSTNHVMQDKEFRVFLVETWEFGDKIRI